MLGIQTSKYIHLSVESVSYLWVIFHANQIWTMREIPSSAMVHILQIITFLRLYLPRWLITLLIMYNNNDFYVIGGIWLINFIKGLLANLQGICEECLVLWICHSERKLIFKELSWASLVSQWLRICLPMQGTRVQALVPEDPTYREAAKPMRHNYWACTLQPMSHNYWSPRATTTEAWTPRTCAPQQEKPSQWEACAPQQRVAPRSPQLEKACAQQRRPNAAKKLIK